MAKFEPGMIVMTTGIDNKLGRSDAFAVFITQSLKRHLKGDWGDLTEHDREVNNSGLKENGMLLSSYEEKGMPKIWIITEGDRSATTLLFPEER